MDFETWLRKQLSSGPLDPGAEVSPRPVVAQRPLLLRPRNVQLIVALVAVLLAVAGMVGAQRAGALDGRLLLPSHPQALPISTWTGTEDRPASAATPRSSDAGRGTGAGGSSRGSGSATSGATAAPDQEGSRGGSTDPGHGGAPAPATTESASPDDSGHGHGPDPTPSAHGGGN